MKTFLRWAALVLALGVFAASATLLVRGSPMLDLTAIESIGLPLGNVIVWAGIVALPTAVYLGFFRLLGHDDRLIRTCKAVLRGLLFLAATWGLACYWLAGNWAFNFSGRSDSFRGSEVAAHVFWTYTVAMVLLPLLVMTLLIVAKLVLARERDGY